MKGSASKMDLSRSETALKRGGTPRQVEVGEVGGWGWGGCGVVGVGVRKGEAALSWLRPRGRKSQTVARLHNEAGWRKKRLADVVVSHTAIIWHTSHIVCVFVRVCVCACVGVCWRGNLLVSMCCGMCCLARGSFFNGVCGRGQSRPTSLSRQLMSVFTSFHARSSLGFFFSSSALQVKRCAGQ